MTEGINYIEFTPLPAYDAAVLRNRFNELPREIDSDDADVEPVPAGTAVGDLSTLKKSFEDLRGFAIQLNADPVHKAAALRAFVASAASYEQDL